MLEQILSFSSVSYAIAVAWVGTLLVLLKVMERIFGLYEKHVLLKRHRRLQELRNGERGESAFTHYLDQAIRLEGFRLVSGVRTSPLKAEALMQLCRQGYWDEQQIRHVAKFLVLSPEQSSPSIRINRSDVIGAWLGLIVATLFFSVGAFTGLSILLKAPGPTTFFVGVGLMVAYGGGSGLLARGFIQYKNAQRVAQWLRDHPATEQPISA